MQIEQCPEIAEDIIRKILEDNPHVLRGDNMVAPVCKVKNGELVKDCEVEGITDKAVTVIDARSVKVEIPISNEIGSFVGSIPKDKNFIHFYQCFNSLTSPVAKGDKIILINPKTFEQYEAIAEQDAPAFVVFRFATS